MRLDLFLTTHNYTESRTRAKNLIDMGNIKINGITVKKPAFDVSAADLIEITDDYEASLGSIKLKKAFSDFDIDVTDCVCIDLGASNGGFTDILLNNGAKKIYALDIGECALPERLKNNDKVSVKDKTNARYIKKSDFEENIDFCTADLSFISLKLVLPAIYDVLKDNGNAILLIKPQFELSKNFLTKNGIVKNKKLIEKVLADIRNFAISVGFKIKGLTEAPHPFEAKNQEYLIWLNK